MCSHSREVPEESESEAERTVEPGAGGGGDGDRESAWDDEKALEVDAGDGCTA